MANQQLKRSVSISVEENYRAFSKTAEQRNNTA